MFKQRDLEHIMLDHVLHIRTLGDVTESDIEHG